MEIKLITGATAYEGAVNTIKQIDTADFEHRNIVVVPDAFSMQAEKLVFDVLGISTTFNIEVVGISRLASKILRNNGIEFQRIGSIEEVFCIYKATLLCENEFQYFKSCGVDLCQKILQVIKQFKACNVAPKDIKPVSDENLDKKMHDLRLIYQKYEELLAEKLDLSKLLTFFMENAKDIKELSKIRLFFANFDSFTTEINSFIVQFAAYVESICIGITKPLSLKNSYIFEKDIMTKTTALAKEYGEVVKVESKQSNLDGATRLIAENLFSLKIGEENLQNEKKLQKNSENLEKNEENLQKNENLEGFFLNVVAKNPKDEVEFLAKYIKNAVFHGKKYADFAVAVSDKKYYELIKNTFSSYGILANTDDAVDLSQTVLGQFVIKMFGIAKLGFSRQTFEYIASSPLCGADENVLSQIYYYQIEDVDEFLEHFPQYKNLINLIKNIKKCKKIAEFCENLIKIIDFIKSNYENFLYKIEKFYKKQSENEQAFVLVQKVVEKLSEVGKDEKISLFDFENLLKLALSSVKVETIPSYLDAVYCADATSSYFEDVDTLFVLGADALPKVQNDTALIDDDDIAKLRLNFKLEPEIKVINRRNRLKLYELLQHAKKKLVVCTPFSHDGRQAQKADFVNDLRHIFGENTLHTVALEDFDLPMFSEEENLDRLLFYVGNQNNLQNAYSTLKMKKKLPRTLASSLFAVIEDELPKNEKTSKIMPEKLREMGNLSASRLETYFSCPFKHFLRYELGVDERKKVVTDGRLFGLFEHELLREFMQTNDASEATEEDVEKFLSENFISIAKQIYEEKTLKNAYFLSFLRNESKIILKNVVKEQKLSKFRPVALEQKVEFPLGKFKMVGKIDRVDECGEYFRIIDYKTGSTGTIQSELYYGKKVQLFLYANAVQKQTNKICAGVYYFDCKVRYKKALEGRNLLNGQTLKSNEVVEMSDCKISEDEKSEVIGAKMRSNAKKDEFAYKNGSFVDSFHANLKYAEDISLKAAEEIEGGYVETKPFKGGCDFCPYIAVCRHRDADGFRAAVKRQAKKSEKTEKS